MSHSRDPRAVLIGLSGDVDAQVRQQAIYTLEYLGDARAVTCLLTLLDDPQLGRTVLWGLAMARDPRAVPPLLARLTSADAMMHAQIVDVLVAMSASWRC
jgi:HEAT repeat protein